MADVILFLHVILVLFNFGALPVIWLGHFRGWHFVRDFRFRVVHLVLIGVVAAESVFGIWCPLTTWEETFRSVPMHQNGFIAHWFHQLLFYDLPAWVFTVAYVAFFLLVVATFFLVRPRFPKLRRTA